MDLRFLFILLLAASGLLSAEPVKKEALPISPVEQDIIEAALDQCLTEKWSVVLDKTSVHQLYRNEDYKKFANSLRDEARRRGEYLIVPGLPVAKHALDKERIRVAAAFNDAVADFLRKNAVETKLIFPRSLRKHTQFVSQAMVEGIFSAGSNKNPNGWDIFYKRFPQAGGLVTVSRPGVDSSHTTAVIYLGEQSHYLIGFGRIYLFKYNGRKWILQKADFFGPSWES